MRLSAKIAVGLLPLVLTGCIPFHRNTQAKNVPVAPPVAPDSIKTVPVELPPTYSTIPSKPTETAKTPTQPAPKKPAHHKSQSAQAAKSATEIAASAPPEVSAIGQLSSGDPADYRRDTEDSIVSIEKSLNGINRNLSDPDRKTADHIREFIKQARQALTSGDVDGAHNLAAKAKVLLDELTK